jgi:proteasome lid subunit RPN8/RPN11
LFLVLGYGSDVIEVLESAVTRLLAHCGRDVPIEACGFLLGSPTRVVEVYPAVNEANSRVRYVAAPIDVLRADRRARELGLDIVGVYHSHPTTEAYPSPTDVANAPDSSWIYVIVSYRNVPPELGAYRIVDETVSKVELRIVA